MGSLVSGMCTDNNFKNCQPLIKLEVIIAIRKFTNQEMLPKDFEDLIAQYPNWMFLKYRNLSVIKNDSVKKEILLELRDNDFMPGYCQEVLSNQSDCFSITCDSYFGAIPKDE